MKFGSLTTAFALCVALVSSGCGYTLQNSRSSSMKEASVEKIYVQPVKNQTYKAGVENLFYNELVQALLAGKRVRLVDRPEIADAILESSVDNANYQASATTDANSIYPTAMKAIQITVATEYEAILGASFTLKRQANGLGTTTLWSSTFSRARRFAGNNQKGAYGTTSALINESEFERALQEAAHSMMQDVHEAMLARF